MKVAIAKEIIENNTQIINSIYFFNETEFENFDNNLKKINLLNSIEDYFKIHENNFLEFISCVKNNSEELLENSLTLLILNKNLMENFKIESNRKLLNYLSSFRTLIDHMNVILDKNQRIKFEKQLNFLYDNEFTYSFIYKLRNYSQHCGLPITNYESQFNNSYAYISLIMEVNTLILNYDSWGIVKPKLLKYSKIDAVSIISDNFNVMKSLYKFLFDILENDLQKAIDEIEKIINPLKGNHKLLILFPRESQESTTVRYIPIEKIEQIKIRNQIT